MCRETMAIMAFRDALALLRREIEAGARAIVVRLLVSGVIVSCLVGFPAPREYVGVAIYDVLERPRILEDLSQRIAPHYNKDRSSGAPYVSRTLIVRNYYHGDDEPFQIQDEDGLLAFLARSNSSERGRGGRNAQTLRYQNIAITGQYGASVTYMIAELLSRQAAHLSSRPPYPVLVAAQDVNKSVDDLVLRTIPHLWYVAPGVLETAERKSVVLVASVISNFPGVEAATGSLLNLTTPGSP